MTFGQFVHILFARWKLAALVVAVVFATAVGVSLALPKQYTASASMVIDLKQDPISVGNFGIVTAPGLMATQIDILKSDRVGRRVVKQLRLSDDPVSKKNWSDATGGRGDYEAWLGAALQKGLEVKPARESNVITIEYSSGDPKLAAEVANAFVKAYSDTVLDLRVDPAKQYSTFFDSRAKQLKEQLEAAQSRLSAYQKEKGMVATDERLDNETSRMNELSAQIVQMQALSAESSSRQIAARSNAGEQLQDVLMNPLISSLKTSLSQAEARLQELNSRLGDNHPMVIEAKANIASLRSRIAAETAKVTSSVGVTNAINKQREADIRAAYETQRQKVLRMKEQRDDAAVLLREVDNAQKAYDAVVARLNQAALESQNNQTNISVLTPATEPASPSFPKTKLNGLIALVLGGGLAAALVYALEMMNRKVRSIDDVTHSLGIPVIGVMPGPDRLGFFGPRTQPLLARRVLGQLPLAGARRN